jgi:anaerobic selenocysteine-containing dehydrogenase
MSASARISTACPLDCPDSCSLDVRVEHGRVAAIDASPRHSVTGGFICAKVRNFGARLYGDMRLLRPAVRTGPRGSGQFAPVSWDEALDLVAQRMCEVRDRWGAEAVLPYFYGGSNGPITQDTHDALLWSRFGASRLERTVCAAPTGLASRTMYGPMAGVSYLDYAEARLVVVWGANPSATGIHLIPYIREARRRGATLVVVDPRSTPLARQADLHLAVRPGTDVVVALALHRYLFENGYADEAFLASRTRGSERLRERASAWTLARAAEVSGVDERDLERFARLYATTSPAVVRCGWGLERNRNGGAAAMAVLALPAVGGKFGVRGGGYTMSNSGVWPLGDARRAWSGHLNAVRAVNMNHLGRALTAYDDPPVKLLFVYNCNPVATAPHQNLVLNGLQREDLFTVVFDQVMTDTARYADVLLPATTFLEHHDLAKAYGPISLQTVRPAIAPVGEARPNPEVFADLAARLGLSEEGIPGSSAETLDRFVAALPTAIARDLGETGAAAPDFGSTPIQFHDVWPLTADGRVDLFPEALDEAAPAGLYAFQADPATPRFPLALISPATERTVSSTLGELRKRPARLEMHPADAAARGIDDGDGVRVFNELGEVLCAAAVTELVRPGTVSLPKGLWQKDTGNGSTSNALVPDSLTDLGGGACFNDARVEVELEAASHHT